MTRARALRCLGALTFACTFTLGCDAGRDAPTARPPQAPSSAPPPLVRGVSIGLYHDTPKLPYEQALTEIRALGANFVNLVVHWYQSDIRSADLAPDPERTPRDATVRRVLARARALGLHVMMMPILQLRTRAPGEWRGKLAPADLPAWRAVHARFILHYARLAAEAGAAVFCVGSELVALESQRTLWSELIADVRRVFPGAVTYSANWDHFEPTPLWDRVDLVGVNGYFEVGKDAAPTVARLAERWTDLRARLLAFAQRHARPLLLTEVGYPSIEGGATWPWHYGRKAPVAPMEQANAYAAFIEVWRAPSPRFAGVFFWNWEGEGGLNDGDYTPRGKPAADLLKGWFTGREVDVRQ